MNWFAKLERKIGRFAIKNLMIYIIGLYIVGMVIFLWDSSFYYYNLSLNVGMILRGQVWRLITFMIMPPGGSNIFFMLISLYVYWMLGSALERWWGAFRFNVFFFGGVFFTILAAFIVYFVYAWILGYGFGTDETLLYSYGATWLVGTEYINFSLFIGYAFTFPESQFLLFFILPIKAKILGWIEIGVYVILFIVGNFSTRIMIGVSLLNVLIFMLVTKKIPRFSPSDFKRKADFKHKVNESRKVNRHKCAICGKTSEDAPDETFRYCSKCEGNYEYCSEHLYTHTHVTKDQAEILNMPK